MWELVREYVLKLPYSCLIPELEICRAASEKQNMGMKWGENKDQLEPINMGRNPQDRLVLILSNLWHSCSQEKIKLWLMNWNKHLSQNLEKLKIGLREGGVTDTLSQWDKLAGKWQHVWVTRLPAAPCTDTVNIIEKRIVLHFCFLISKMSFVIHLK